MNAKFDYTTLPFISRLVKMHLQGANTWSTASAYPTQENIARKSFPSNSRSILVRVLKEQNCRSHAAEVIKNIELLAQSNAYTVTTGHQLNILTGPAFFMFKIVHVIKLAESLNKQYPDKHFVPIYWMASEDHDFEEIAEIDVFGKKLRWNTEQTGPVGRMKCTGLDEVVEEFIQVGGVSNDLAEILREYAAFETLSEATRYLVDQLFGKFGLVTIDPDHVELKHLFKEIMLQDVRNETAFREVSNLSNEMINQGHSTQINPRRCNLFYLSDGQRYRMDKDEAGVLMGHEIRSIESVTAEMEAYPERFSPNVVLRPLYQETILPNIAVIGGPGEVAYWLQLERLFQSANIPYPAIVLRSGGVVISNSMLRKMERLGLTFLDFVEGYDEIVKKWLSANSGMTEWERESYVSALESLANEVDLITNRIDKSLSGKVQAMKTKWVVELDAIEKSLIRASKQKEEVSLNQISQIRSFLFPEGVPQERSMNGFVMGQILGRDLVETFGELVENRKSWYFVMT
ncbi:MAG: hypothetical protein RL226_177 [Bacteroidota bacterium]